jgi:acyl carrier protein
MERQDLVSRVEEIYKEILEVDAITLSDEMTANDVEGWDSLTHSLLINQVQKEFEVKFKLREVISLKNVGELFNLIESKLA